MRALSIRRACTVMGLLRWVDLMILVPSAPILGLSTSRSGCTAFFLRALIFGNMEMLLRWVRKAHVWLSYSSKLTVAVQTTTLTNRGQSPTSSKSPGTEISVSPAHTS